MSLITFGLGPAARTYFALPIHFSAVDTRSFQVFAARTGAFIFSVSIDGGGSVAANRIEITQGDAFTLELKDKEEHDFTNYKVRAELYGSGLAVRKGSANVIGGSDAMVDVSDADTGIFRVVFDNVDTDAATTQTAKVEVEVESPTGDRQTIHQGDIKIKAQRVDWDDVS